MNKSETIGNLAKALAAAQKDIQAAKQNANNPFFKSKYADLGSIIESARIPLATNGLSVSQSPYTRDGAIGVETLLMHESGEWLSNEISLPLGEVKGKSLAQELGSIITYLRRYAYAATVCAYADEDTDGNGTAQKTSKPAESQPAERKPIVNPAPTFTEPSAKNAARDAFMARAAELSLETEAAEIARKHIAAKSTWAAALAELNAFDPTKQPA